MRFLDRLRDRRDDMTTGERLIAAHLESGFPHAGLESATAVADKVGVSTSTVVRFIAKLGYESYLDFQRELRAEVESRLASPLQRLEQAPRPIEAVESAPYANGGDTVAQTIEAAMSCLTRTYATLDRRALDAIVDLFDKATGTTWILGDKKARSIALYLYAQLNLCIAGARLLNTDSSFYVDQLLDVGPNDVVVVIDVRRYVESTVKLAKWCVERGATLVVLADTPSSPLYKDAHHRLTAAVTGGGAFDSYIGLMLTVDLVTNALVAVGPERVKRRLTMGEAAWSQLSTFHEIEKG